MGRRSDMELHQGRSILHRCARSGDVVHAGLVVTLLIGKSLAVIPYYPTLVPLFSCLLVRFPSGAAAKMLQFLRGLHNSRLLNKLGYLLLFVELDLLKDLRFRCLERLQSGRTRFPLIPLVKERDKG